MKQKILVWSSILILMAASCEKKESTIWLEVQSTDYESQETPVHVQVTLPEEVQKEPVEHISVTLDSQDGNYKDIPGQITLEDDGENILWWILPKTSEDKPLDWKATFHESNDSSSHVFSWSDDPGKHMDLLFENKKVFRYEYQLDSQFVKGETLTARNKVFYHIYDLAGEHLITNGYEDGVWPHHRGIMIGWRDVGFGDQELSFWGMEDLTTQKHIKFIKKTAGPVLAQLEAIIHWNDSTGTTLIEEHRKATLFHEGSPVILTLDFSSILKAVNGPVTLDGNAEHAGVQYRAHNDVAAEAAGSAKPTYYFDQDSIDPKEDYNLPWVGMSYGLNHKTYSVVEMSDEGNPKPSIWSAYRDYGRFGPYIKYDLDNNKILNVNYRFWISESTMPEREKIAAQYEAYQHPPKVKVN